ncbi:retrotransposon protein, putative, ty1-copia subclass [Tanacetum coccineum]
MKHEALYLYMGNGVRAQVEAIRSFDLILPNGLVICLDTVIMHLLLLEVLVQFLSWLTMVLSNVLWIMVFQFLRMMFFIGMLFHLTIEEANILVKSLKIILKACGIVQQLTPPHTPQHNGMSKRRNRTLLYIVRLMMNLTTLPLSFWDYALESATRILNMVATKKVDKKPYELWYGKVPNLSYLKVWGYEALVKRDTPDKLQ